MEQLRDREAIILKGVGGQYLLHRYKPKFQGLAVPRGIFRKNDQVPLPGDRVVYADSGDPDIPYVIDRILTRKNELKRPPMANLDILLITVSAALPEADLFLVDRLIAYAIFLQIEPVLLLTKLDLAGPDSAAYQTIRNNYLQTGLTMIDLGHGKVDELDRLRDLISGQLVAFAGQSGVGKSSLLNRLFGQDLMVTGGLSEKIGRGRQTTRHIELFPYKDSYIADTPGFQTISFDQVQISPEEFTASYPEFKGLASGCRFANCSHSHEPGCKVREASADQIYPDRLRRYQILRKEIEEAMSRY